MTLIKYGTIGVTAAAVITGVLWYQDVRKSPRIEDIAALRAAVHERSELWTALGSYTPDFGTNVFVGVHQLWDSLYTESMSGARLLATSVWHGVDGITVMWAPEPLSNGTSIASAEVGWQCVTNAGIGGYHYTNYDWRRTAPVKLNQAGSSTACIIVRQLTDNILPGTPTQRLEVAAACYGGGTPVVDHESEIYGGTNNWWETIGVHSNIYGYGCEIWHQLSLPATISQLGGSAWTITPHDVRLRFGADTDVELADANSQTRFYQAAAFRLDSEYGSVYTAAYATPAPGVTEIWLIEVDETAATITESATNQPAFRVRTLISPPGGGTYNFAVSVATSDTIESVSPAMLYFNPTDWNQWQQVYVTTGVHTTGVDRTGVIRIGNNDYIALRINSADPKPTAVALTPLINNVAQNSSVTIAATSLTNITPTVKYDRRMTTNNLDQCLRVIEGLNRTWAFVDFDSSIFSATSVVASAFGDTTNLTAIFDGALYDVADVADAIAAMADSPSSPSAVDNPLLYLYASGLITSSDYYGSTYSEAVAGLNLQYTDLLGCSFDYPCNYAIASNLVDTIRVYAVLSCATGKPISSAFDVNITNILSFSADETDPSKYESYLFNLIERATVRHRPSSPAISYSQAVLPITNSTITTVERVGDYSHQYVDTPVVLLATLDCSGGHRPLFDISPARMASFPLDASDYQQQQISYQRNFFEDTYTHTDIKFEQRIYIDFFIVEVDWNFQHCNPDKSFEPATNTPPWAAKAE